MGYVIRALETTARQALATSILSIVRSGDTAERGDSMSKASDRRKAKIAEMKKGA
jgi:hypothetical protein